MTTTLPVAGTSERRWQRVKAPTLLAAGVLGASVLLHLHDPHQSGSWGYCPWLLLTGTACPGCGGLRAVNDLTRGDLAAAASSNVLFVGSIPLLTVLWARWFADRWHGVRRTLSTPRAYVYSGLFLAVALTFWVARNLPSGSWLAP
ncbi:MAG TPA: DUF2752 domain-containing protein [Nocardioidaceae bacterium]|nr:DUF2752 domain-containing protein [Nocardioidaceae bacterium]